MKKKQLAKPEKDNSLVGGSAQAQPQAGTKVHRDGVGRDKFGNVKYQNEKKGRPRQG